MESGRDALDPWWLREGRGARPGLLVDERRSGRSRGYKESDFR